jgi:hypothetical protein
MITVLQKGLYTLIETKSHTKILTLDGVTYAWIVAKDIGEILVTSHVPHKADHTLATGVYRLYDVKDEPHLSDQLHLELNVGEHLWQGYLLLTGLPDDKKKRTRIIPTREVVSSGLSSVPTTSV